ncbi:MAG: hypothetical protein LUE06_02295 [Oscillospiraceae bacterium]|nr:hypothetical protein [Oscillospiraceae bacterium]
MDEIYMIHLDDYLHRIDDMLTLYVMLRQTEAAISKLPDCESSAELRRHMASLSPYIKEMWDSWNIPARYLASGDVEDLRGIMDEELIEPEDAGYFCEESRAAVADVFAEERADLAKYYLFELTKKSVDFTLQIAKFAREVGDFTKGLLADRKELDFLFCGDEETDSR